MKKIVISLFFIILLGIGLFSSNGIANHKQIIFVDDDNIDGPWDGSEENPFRFIQDAIDAANDGDTVSVLSGMYAENVNIGKPIILQGEAKKYTIIDAGGKNDGVYIGSDTDGVTISGFTIQNSGNYSDGYSNDAGIDVHSNEVEISDNIIINHPRCAIQLIYSDNNIIKNNEIFESGNRGFLIGSIILYFSNENNISRNFITQNKGVGISVRISKDNIITQNTISDNFVGLSFWDAGGKSTNNLIFQNIIMNNRDGVNIRLAGNTFLQNNFINNTNSNALTLPIAPARSPPYLIRNSWQENYWDDWVGHESPLYSMFPKYILFGFDFDWYPAEKPYDIPGGDFHQ